MTISCYRGAGDIEAPPIIEPLLSESVLLDRGITEINANSTQFNRITLSIVYRDGVRLGQIVEVSNPTGNYYAKIVGLSFELRHGNASLNLTLDRPL